MKILEINKFYYIKGGSERHYFDVIKLLENKGHEIIPFSMKNDNNFASDYENYFISRVDFKKFSLKNIFNIFWNFEAVRKLNKLIKKEKPKLAHIHNIAHQLSPAIIKALKKNKVPIVQTLHDYKAICPAYAAFRANQECFDCRGGKYFNCVKNKCHKNSRSKSLLVALESFLHNQLFKTYNDVDFFIAPSEYLKNVHVEFGIPKEKIVVINNFIDHYNLPRLDSVSGDTDNYFLYFGRLSKEKGIDFLCEAFHDLGKSFKLKIVGDGPIKKELQNKIEKLSLNNQIEILGYKTGEDLNNLIHRAKAVILPSLCLENMPYSLLEAMHLGKIVIASNTGGIPEIIRDGKNGFLFKRGNKDDLIQKIRGLNNHDLLVLSKKSQESVSKLNPENYYQKFSKIIDRVVCF